MFADKASCFGQLPPEKHAGSRITDLPLPHEIVQGWLWQPSVAQDLILRQDWEELMDRIVLGEQADITAKEGQYLQIRPKAAHSRVMAKTRGDDGEASLINPKGFYLRTAFTRELLATQYK